MAQYSMIPSKTMLCKLLDGHPVRVVDYDPIKHKVRVKSLRTGLPFTVNRAFVVLPQPTA